MGNFISKVLQLGGYFYITLALVIVISFFLDSRLKGRALTIILAAGMFFAVLTSISQITGQLGEARMFFRGDREKLESSTFNQFFFAGKIRETLKPQDNNCIFWSWDIATRYLNQESYPVRLNSVRDMDSSQECDFIVSQFTSRPELHLSPFITFENNFIYKLKK